MPQTLQITRTGTNGNSPISGSLAPGQLAIEMGTPTRLWVGVPATNAPALQKLIYDSSVAAATISDTPPLNATPGQLWWESDSGSTYIWYDDGTSAQWVQTEGVSAYVKLTGDVMTGPLVITSLEPVSIFAEREIQSYSIRTEGNAYILGELSVGTTTTTQPITVYISGTYERQLIFQTGTSPRWRVGVSTSLDEIGAQSGSNFSIARYDDNGVIIDASLTINRVSNIVDFAVRPTVGGTPIAADLGLPDILERLAALEAARPK